jgi:hypothetical protein
LPNETIQPNQSGIFDYVKDLPICQEKTLAKIERPTQSLEEYARKRPANDPKRRQMKYERKRPAKDAAKFNAAKFDHANKQKQKKYDALLIPTTKEAVKKAAGEETIRQNKMKFEKDRIEKIGKNVKRKKDIEKRKQENQAKRQKSEAEKDEEDQKAVHAQQVKDEQQWKQNEPIRNNVAVETEMQNQMKRQKTQEKECQNKLSKLENKIAEKNKTKDALQKAFDEAGYALQSNKTKDNTELLKNAKKSLQTVKMELHNMDIQKTKLTRTIKAYEETFRAEEKIKQEIIEQEKIQEKNEKEWSEAMTDDGIHDHDTNKKMPMECKCDDKDACDSNCCKDESDKLTIKTPDSSKKPIDLNKRPEIVHNVLTINQPLSKTASLEAIRHIDHEEYDEMISSSIQTAKQSFLNMTSDMNFSELLRGLQ